MRALAAIVLVAALPTCAQAQSLGCADLNGAYVVSQESPPRYLGFFGSRFATESIMNEFGTFGSRFNNLSVRNTFGPYGSSFAPFSATNRFTTTPPLIVRSGQFLAFLSTVNSPFSVPLETIDTICGATFFTASAPFAPVVAPPPSAIPPIVVTPPPSSFVLTDAYGGTFANAARGGEGAQITFGQVDGQRFLLLAVYTYDLQGNPMWLFGANPVPSNSRGPHRIDVVRTRGARFGQAFNPADVVREQWGTVSVTFLSCDAVGVVFNSTIAGFGGGEVEMTRVLPRTANAQCP
jgi:hypothetical protein